MGEDLREQGAFGDELEEELELGASDPESRAAAVSLAVVAQDTKAQDVQVLQVGHMVSWTSYFVLLTVTSQPQMTAVLAKIAREAKEKLDWAALRPTDGRCDSVDARSACREDARRLSWLPQAGLRGSESSANPVPSLCPPQVPCDFASIVQLWCNGSAQPLLADQRARAHLVIQLQRTQQRG